MKYIYCGRNDLVGAKMKSKNKLFQVNRLSKAVKATLPFFAMFGGGAFATTRNHSSSINGRKTISQGVVNVVDEKPESTDNNGLRLLKKTKKNNSAFAAFTKKHIKNKRAINTNPENVIEILKSNHLLSTNKVREAGLSGNTVSKRVDTNFRGSIYCTTNPTPSCIPTACTISSTIYCTGTVSCTFSPTVNCTTPTTNLTPTIINSSNISVAENQINVIDVEAVDDFDTEGSGLSFFVSGGVDAALFDIDMSFGLLTFVVPQNFEAPNDNGGDRNYEVEVTVTDSGGLSDQVLFNVTLTNIFEPATDIVLSQNSINQSVTAAGSTVGLLSSIDEDTISFDYTLVADGVSGDGSCGVGNDLDNGSFQIFGDVLQTASQLNSGSYNVCVQTDDAILNSNKSLNNIKGVTSSFQKTFNISVIDDVAPVITAVSIPDAPSKVLDTVDVTITVEDDGGDTYNNLVGTIDGFPLQNLMRVNSTTYSASFDIIDGGIDVASSDSVPVSLALDDGVANASNTYNTAISQANDAIYANLPDVTLTANPTTITEAGGVSILTASLTGSLMNQWPVDIGVNLGYSGSATMTTDYSAPPIITILAFNSTAIDAITAVADADVEGPEIINVDINTITGGGVENGVQQAIITIEDTNSPPVINSVPVTSVNEDDLYTYTFFATDVDVGDVLILSDPIRPNWLNFDPATGILSAIPSDSEVGTHNVTLRVSDGDSDVDQSFAIEVINVNDVPTGSVIIQGELIVGSTLAADTSNIGDDDGLGPFVYQWRRDGADIIGANSPQYKLTSDDLGALISVLVTYRDGFGTDESLAGVASGPVNPIPVIPAVNKYLLTVIMLFVGLFSSRLFRQKKVSKES